MKYTNLVNALIDRGNNLEANIGITYIGAGGKETYVSYPELFKQAKNVLFNLQSQGIKKGDELLFQLTSNETFVPVFWACILGGIIPVPLANANNENLKQKFINVWEKLNKPFLIASEKTKEKLLDHLHSEKEHKKYGEVVSQYVDEATIYEHTGEGEIYHADENDIAFIQFSSGSTGKAKGVVLTHENLVVNIYAMRDGIQPRATGERFLSWLPLTHDMGIIGFHLGPFIAGWNQYLMQTEVFTRRPNIWLDKISEHNISTAVSPNFGYSYVLKYFKPEDANTLDLSCLRYIFNGAEPISYDLSKKFTTVFAPYGFKEHTITPVYGLAEASLCVTISDLATPMECEYVDRTSLHIGGKVSLNVDQQNAIKLVKLGKVVNDCEMRAVDSNGNVVADRTVGKIEIKGKNVTKLYYNDPEVSTKLIRPDGWVDTGDLGYIDNGELVLTGRVKDVIFINGMNFYGHDIEFKLATKSDELELGKVIAFGFYDEIEKTQKLGVFIQTRKKEAALLELATVANETISSIFGINISKLIPVKKIPKTTSGKVQRFVLEKQFLNHEFTDQIVQLDGAIPRAHPKETATEDADESESPSRRQLDIVKNSWQKIIGLQEVDTSKTFFESGGSSLKAAELAITLSDAFGVHLPVEIVFEYPLISDLTTEINRRIHEAPITDTPNETPTYDEFFPLSSSQKRLYYLYKNNPTSLAYNIAIALSISGEIDIEKVENTLQTIIQRHASLRTSFVENGMIPTQKIHENVSFSLSFQKIDEKDANEHIKAFVQPFDLQTTPLIRSGIFQHDTKKYTWIIDIPHIIADGLSMSVLYREFVQLYHNGEVSTIDFSIQEYIANEDKFRHTETYKTQGLYWKEQFQDSIPLLELPLDHDRPTEKSEKGDRIPFQLDATLTQQIRTVAKEHNVTVHTFMLSVYYLLLSKYSQQEDIVVGVPASVRNTQASLHGFGMMTNMLAIRTQPTAQKKFSTYVHEVGEHIAGAYKNKEYLFEDLVDTVVKQRILNRQPVFDVVFTFQDMKLPHFDTLNWEVALQPLHTGFSKFDLWLEIVDLQETLQGSFEYATDIFSKETIAQFATHFNTLLKNIVQKPTQLLSNIECLQEEEKTALTTLLNNTDVQFPKKTICDIFETIAVTKADKTAIVYNNTKISYQELAEKSDQVAAYLSKENIATHQPIALYFEPSIEMIVSIIGVLKHGCSYVPIAPSLPEKRKEFMLNDSNSAVLLTSENLTAIDSAIKTICIETIEKEAVAEVKKVAIQPTDQAYIIYTSGTSGTPKGVAISHENVVRLFFTDKNKFDFNDTDVWSLFHAYNFDFSVWELFGALLFGGSLVIVPEDIRKDAFKFHELLAIQKVTVLNQTPSSFYNLATVANTKPEETLSIRYVIFGGEELMPKRLTTWDEQYPDTKLINMYGITETTVHVTYKEIGKAEIANNSKSIGKPIPTLKAMILDANLNIVPKGVKGELFIGGKGLSNNYINNPELTKEKFINNPFQEGEKLYRSGDVARINAANELEYFGRLDAQIQIRGHRVELKEIEECLQQYAEITNVTVIAFELGNEQVLSAYYTAKTPIDERDFRTWAATVLPNYMIPAFFNKLDAMPLTSNGKIDKKSFEKPETFLQEEKTIKPANEVEAALENIWFNVLGLEKQYISTDKNFFELGGSSIKIVNVVKQVSEANLGEISVVDAFKYPTIKMLAAHLTKGKQSSEDLKRDDKIIAKGKERLKQRFKRAKKV
ncbi:non-ribosomal peptide synthetase [Kordia jejudonensis]|uniref:non-ribosomal peptide synthetase n=1 Tax=Kordia jejudonensis TaxID=1348245 RepID=UPI0006298DAB|nr:non-ribosomal peptide synthetase [Kordia jejudonensis]